MRFILLLILSVSGRQALAQGCPKDFTRHDIQPYGPIAIVACSQNMPGPAGQRVFFGLRNNTNDEYEIRFTKVIETTCGNKVTGNASTIAKPKEVVLSGAFAGEITFELILEGKDCPGRGNRIRSVYIQDLVMTNLSEKKRKEEEQERKKMEERQREQERQNSRPAATASAGLTEKKDKDVGTSSAQSKSSTSSKSASKASKSSDSKKGSSSGSSGGGSAESDHDREMRTRREVQNQKDKAEDQASAAEMGTTAAVMGAVIASRSGSDDDEEDDEISGYLRGNIGLVFGTLPVTENTLLGIYNYASGQTTYTKSSSASTTGPVGVMGGLSFAIMTDKPVSLELNPFAMWCRNAFSSGYTGTHLTYGGRATIGIGGKFRVLLNGEYIKRNGEVDIDLSPSGLDIKGYTNYDYSAINYGIGGRLYMGGGMYFDLLGFRENLSFLKGTDAQVYTGELRMYSHLLAFTVKYGSNYPVGGELAYKNNVKKEAQDFWQFSIYVPIKIATID